MKPPFNGWPTATHAERAQSHTRPIVSAAKFRVECGGCGAAFDSAETEIANAIEDVRWRHRCARMDLSATKYEGA